MTPPIIHDQFSIERFYPHSPSRVFGALSEPAKKRRWFAEEAGAAIESYCLDFRAEGFERCRFRFGDGPPMTNDSIYFEIVPDARVVFAYHMTIGGAPLSSSLASMELVAEGDGTRVIYTEHTMHLDGKDASASRREGCEYLLERLAKELEAHS